MSGEVDDWQAGRTFAETNKLMFERQVECDVNFIVGPEQILVPAHKFILISRSSVFYAMFCGPVAGNTVDTHIEITDIEPEIFKMLLMFMYCEEARVDTTNALPLLYAAKKYAVQSLIDRCTRRLKGLMIPETVCLVFEHAHMFDELELKQKCKQFIFQQPTDVLRSDTFCDLRYDCLVELLKSDELGVPESLILEAALRWSEKECQRRNEEVTPENQRKALDGALYLIRFPVMDQVYFSDHVSNEEILSAEEKVELFRYFCGQKKFLEHFSNQKRVNRLIFMRFPRVSSGWSYVQDKADAIAFQASHDLVLHGFFIYGSNQASTSYNISYAVMKSEEEVLTQKKTTIHTDGVQKVYEVLLDNNIDIKKEEVYNVKVSFRGPCSYQGQEGRQTVSTEDVTITFLNSDIGTNGTNIGVGQLPGLVFSYPAEKEGAA